MLHALGEGPLEIAPILASAFLHIVDSPRTRAYLQVGADLEVRSNSLSCRLSLFSRWLFLPSRTLMGKGRITKIA